MKKVKSIHAGLIAAVLLASVSTSASAVSDGLDAFRQIPVSDEWGASRRTPEQQRAHLEHWAPYDGPLEYFFMCTIAQQCEGSKWR